MTVFPQCFQCRHYRGRADAPDRPYVCDAFPAPPGIPQAILLGEHDHAKPFPGDHGVRFEPLPSAAPESR